MDIHLPLDLTELPNAAVLGRLAAAWNPLDLAGSLRLITYEGSHGHLLIFSGFCDAGRDLRCSTIVPDALLRSTARARDAAKLFREFVRYVEECAEWGYQAAHTEEMIQEALGTLHSGEINAAASRHEEGRPVSSSGR
jgi:hypothetical protein